MLYSIISLMQCPVCASRLARRGSALACKTGHAFDIARQGCVNLLPGDAHTGTADTAEMVASRARVFDAGCYRPLLDAVAEVAGEAASRTQGPTPPAIIDVGAGTGEYLAAALDRSPSAIGLALDLSKHAMRRAARAHPRMGAAVCDAWRALPVRDGAADVLLNIFAPRNAAEYARVLAPGGTLVVVTPLQEHLAELVGPLGMIAVDGRKEERLEATLGGHFERENTREVRASLTLPHDLIRDLVLMGPSAHHVTPGDLDERIARLDDPFGVTLAAAISVWRHVATGNARASEGFSKHPPTV